MERILLAIGLALFVSVGMSQLADMYLDGVFKYVGY
jgi:hypothetical protein